MGLGKTAVVTGVIVLGVGGVLAVLRPDRAAYEAYATEQLTRYLESEVCGDIPANLGNILPVSCEQLLRDNQPQIRQLISNGTTEHNYQILSIFHTRLGLQELPMVPSYEFETAGIAGRFITYRAEEL